MTEVPACEPLVLCNGAYKRLLDCDLKCPMIWKFCHVYVIYHMYILATDLGELMKIMVVCAEQQDGILIICSIYGYCIISTNFLN